MDLSEALTMIDKVVRDSTSAIDNTKEMASKEIPEKKKPVKQTVAPMRRSERLNPTPPSMIRRIKKQPRNRQASKKIGPPYVEPLKKKTVYNVDDDSFKGSEVIELDYGFIEDRRDYDGHDLLSEDDKSQIEGFLSFPITHEAVLRTHRNTEVLGIHIHDILFDGGMTEGYVIDVYFDLLDARFNEKPEVYKPCLFGNHFAQIQRISSSSSNSECESVRDSEEGGVFDFRSKGLYKLERLLRERDRRERETVLPSLRDG
ncbi:hypothetical protein QJS10_CPB20g00907 [Acorus calamus]|uniref:Uncharacterized protein n=1 Tax=Acorus calamus TaxID=4465 RepID=A0AAV9CDI8_ACOCL|nr:hypothetical protein QJS10_CPB20g00907 [Acorus calamus]